MKLVARVTTITALLAGSAIAQEPALNPSPVPVPDPAPAPAPAPAPVPAATPITVTGEKPAPKPKVVCKDTTTGTALRKRICMTEADWSKAARNSEENLKAMRQWQRVRCGYGSIC